ncbi:helix-turn-helix domain-containing protein [Vibrio intestinalis]|uniref:helix-turn-helix domain-containing protein n=1 Tax=Vibrio intestinalis TaxID=2933291 RepID=UPI0021A86287
MKRAIWAALLYFISTIVYAFDSSPSVFYPLPMQSQGRVVAAKQLFLAEGGGLWIHDVKDKVLFFDGQTVSPKFGSALPYKAEQVVFHAKRFWTFSDNSIYRSTSQNERELVFSLPPGSEIIKIGASRGYIWVTDETAFYTYHVASGEFSTYSLMELYQYSQDASLKINDALLIRSKWTLATNAGVFVSEGSGHFQFVPKSNNRYIEKLYFSEERRELIIGSNKGAVVVDINDTSKPKFVIAAPHTLAIAETKEEYWVGTENGLFVYSFLTGETRQYTGEEDAGYTLEGRKVHSIINDDAGGMWIGTNKGVHYFSLFGDKFQRFPSQELNQSGSGSQLIGLKALSNGSGYLAISHKGVFVVEHDYEHLKEYLYKGKVNDVLEWQGNVWIATNQGIICIDLATGYVVKDDKLPLLLKSSTVEFLEVDKAGNIWGADESHLWSYHVKSGALVEFGSEWMQGKHLPARLTYMLVTERGHLVLGTEHGIYVLKAGLLHFVSGSVDYGAVHSIAEANDDNIWIASNYGVFQLNLRTEYLQTLPTIDEHITPKCVVSNPNGMWLTSSAGLSHYTFEGELVGHYGQPFGIINNEFSAGFCLNDTDAEATLLLGSWHSLVRINTQDLSVSPMPEARAIFSHVRVNQAMVSFGSVPQEKVVVPYGESIGFQIGVLPQVSGSTLEYRLSDETRWTTLDGFQIAFEGLYPGKYTLHVRPVVNGLERGRESSFHFRVTEPWYLSMWAFALYIVTLVSFIGVIVYWRSRIMTVANRELKSQVALKTNQLRHQSRILLSNNHQLRKQLQVRRLIFSQAIHSFRERLSKSRASLSDEKLSAEKKMIDQISSELELLLNVRESQNHKSPAYNLGLIFGSVLSGWKEEMAKSGLTLEIEARSNRDKYVALDYFNLDVMFNLIFDSFVKRCFRHQTIEVEICHKDEFVALVMTDFGTGIDTSNNSSWAEILALVEVSGGVAEVTSADGHNEVILSWPRTDPFDEHTIVEIEQGEDEESFVHAGVYQDPWLEKLEGLVIEHFSDSDFGTSTAAKMMFVSERSLQRRFKNATQRTFTDYLNEIRLDKACRRLLAGEKVSDVAFECGFNDPSYFSQKFKHRFGVSPTQFVEGKDSNYEIGADI